MKPLERMIVNSPYGPRVHPISKDMSFHSGVDLKASYEKAYAVADGTVRIAKSSKYSIGNYIVIDHDGFTTIYGHMDSWNYEAGEFIIEGDVIGKTGNSGGSTGPHLHFEIRLGNPQTLWSKDTTGRYNQSIDPIPYLDSMKVINYQALYEEQMEKWEQVKELLIEIGELLG